MPNEINNIKWEHKATNLICNIQNICNDVKEKHNWADEIENN